MGESGPTLRSVAVEVVVIVASILLAFAIDASWDARSERIETRSVLVDLESEFRENLARIDRIIEIRENRAAQAKLLLQGSSAFPDDASLDEALVHVFLGATTVNLSTGAFSAYVAGGNAARIESRELRRLLFGTFPEIDAAFRTKPRDLLSDSEFHNLTVVRLELTRVLLREARALRSATADILERIARELDR